MTDKELLEQFQSLVGMMEKMSDQMATKDFVKDSVDERIRHTEILIENTVTKRIDSLFDGYKLAHEKQYELEREFERRTAEMQSQIDNIQARLYELEKKTAS